jgi:hypothetical protein
MLYFVASKAYTDIPDAPPEPSLPPKQQQPGLNSGSSYNASLVALVPSELLHPLLPQDPLPCWIACSPRMPPAPLPAA